MAQTTLPGASEGVPRPLPRGGVRLQRPRDTRPHLHPLDAAWMAALAALFAGLSAPSWGRQPQSMACLAASLGVVVLTYLLGWRASGRQAGVIAGLLLATSGTFAVTAFHSLPLDLAALATLAALFAFVAGSSLAALAFAAAVVWLRPDCGLLGLLLLTFTLLQHRKRAWLGAVLFLVPMALAAFFLLSGRHSGIPQVAFGFHTGLWVWLAAPATLFTAWFLLPFSGEMADPIRRARWLPLVLWTALYALAASVLVVGRASEAAAVPAPFLPLWFLLVGAGLARLLPIMAGDLPIPALRYVVATLAILSLVAIRARAEWPLWSHRAAPSSLGVTQLAAFSPTKPRAEPAATPPAVAPPKPKPIIARHSNAVLKAAQAKPAKPKVVTKPKVVKPAVRLYVVRNGKLVRRSKWAVQWDLTHPQTVGH